VFQILLDQPESFSQLFLSDLSVLIGFHLVKHLFRYLLDEKRICQQEEKEKKEYQRCKYLIIPFHLSSLL
jgi:hypothetical protein